MDQIHPINEAITNFQEIVQKPENFLNASEMFSDQIKCKLKDLYGILKLENLLLSNALPELLTKEFETEQIFQQIELQNDSFTKKALTDVSKVLSIKEQLVFNSVLENTSEITETTEHMEINKSESESSESSSDEYEPERLQNGTDITEAFSDDESIPEQSTEASIFGNKQKKSIVDDDFFKLDEMETFLRVEESKLDAKNEHDQEKDSDSDEGSIDLFKSDSDDDESVKKAKFKDFFVSRIEEKETKRNKFLEELPSDDDTAEKSTFELVQERLHKRIEAMEENAITEKPWTLKGEITAENRPQNSLLEEVVEFDLTSRPAPIITENITHQLEDIIKQRIKDKQFDSVQRKEKPVENLLEYKKKLVLDQEKSKHSLAQIYENEFLNQQAALETDNAEHKEDEPEVHKEIKTMMRDLFNKLDSLSNFHFTPKPAVPELKIITNLQAITMEEVAPVTTSEATLLAPEEVRNKPKGDVIGKSERTKTDKKRERRKKKLKQKLHIKQTINKNLVTGNKFNKKSTKGKNTQKMEETLPSKNFKSSKAFFTQLQEQVQSTIKSVKDNNHVNKNSKALSAKRLKL